MGFDASKAVEPLNYDFTAYGGKKGTIAEPTAAQIGEFFTALQRAVNETIGKRSTSVDPNSAEGRQEMLDTMANLDENAFENMQTRMVEAVADLCSGSPDVAAINKLPYRVQQRFIEWISGEFAPEARTAGTKR